ncbi:MAG: serine/threonine-protein phosphatase [Clostridia bacterium]|nr:serine/threonine-protein phosphatase [Clostridia bacterium]
MYYEITYSCMSVTGNVRKMNQDNFICNGVYLQLNQPDMNVPVGGTVTSETPTLFGVFDGMGGEECGEVASLIAAQEAMTLMQDKNDAVSLSEYCFRANDKICDYANSHSVSSMGTTAAMMLFGAKGITLCNIGDSKIFRFADNGLEQISQDHVAMAPFGRKPPLSQNLGIPPQIMVIEPYLSQGEYNDGDRFLICSDGLTDMVSNEEIQEMLQWYSTDEAVANLVGLALENGGRDNISIIAIDIKQIRSNLLDIF